MGDAAPEAGEPALQLSVAEINALVAAFFDEAGLAHSAFTLRQESRLDAVRLDGGMRLSEVQVPPGHLIRLLMKGLLYLEAEAQWRGEDTTANPPRLLGYNLAAAPPFRPIPREPPAGISPTAGSPSQRSDTPKDRVGAESKPRGRVSSARTTPPVSDEDRMDTDERATTAPPAPVASTSKVQLDDPPVRNGMRRASVDVPVPPAMAPATIKRKDRDSVGPSDGPTGASRLPGKALAELPERRDGKRQRTDMKLDIPPQPSMSHSAPSSTNRPTPPPMTSLPRVDTPASRPSPGASVPAAASAATTPGGGYFPLTTREFGSAKPPSRPGSSRGPAPPERTGPTPLSGALPTPNAASMPARSRPTGLGVPTVSVSVKTIATPVPAPPPTLPPLASTSKAPVRRSTSPIVPRRQRSRSPTGPKSAVPPDTTKPVARQLSASDKGKGKSTTARSPAKAKAKVNGAAFHKKGDSEDDGPPPPPKGPDPEHVVGERNILVLSAAAGHTIPCSWNESYLATGSEDAFARIYDVPAHRTSDLPLTEVVACKHAGGRKAEVTGVAWNPDGTLLATTCDDTVVRLWTVTGELSGVLSMHQNPPLAVKWAPNGQYLATCGMDYSVIVWNAAVCQVRKQWQAHGNSVLDVAWFDDTYLASCSADSQIHLLDVNRPNPVYRFRGHMDEVNQLRFDPSRSLLASGSDDKSVRVWSLVGLVGPRANDREAEEGEDLPDLECRGGTIALRGHTTEVTMIEWMPKGGMGGRKRLLASGAHDGQVRLWDVDSAACLFTLERQVSDIYCLAFRPGLGDILAAGSGKGRVCFWSMTDGKLVAEYLHGGDSGIAYEVNWHPKRNQVVVCGTGVVVLSLDGILPTPASA